MAGGLSGLGEDRDTRTRKRSSSSWNTLTESRGDSVRWRVTSQGRFLESRWTAKKESPSWLNTIDEETPSRPVSISLPVESSRSRTAYDSRPVESSVQATYLSQGLRCTEPTPTYEPGRTSSKSISTCASPASMRSRPGGSIPSARMRRMRGWRAPGARSGTNHQSPWRCGMPNSLSTTSSFTASANRRAASSYRSRCLLAYSSSRRSASSVSPRTHSYGSVHSSP